MKMTSGLKEFSDEERGLVGIGTLIIFIALILVSAVAAGVIIRTSGQLRQQARATGEEAIRNVSTGVKVLHSKGRVSSGSNKIDNAEILVRLRAGSSGVNFEDAVLQYLSDNVSKHLELGRGSDNLAGTDVIDNFYLSFDSKSELETYWDNLDANEFAIVKHQGATAGENHSLGTSGALASIWINVDLMDTLEEGESADVVIMPKIGVETRAGLIVPPTLDGYSIVDL